MNYISDLRSISLQIYTYNHHNRCIYVSHVCNISEFVDRAGPRVYTQNSSLPFRMHVIQSIAQPICGRCCVSGNHEMFVCTFIYIYIVCAPLCCIPCHIHHMYICYTAITKGSPDAWWCRQHRTEDAVALLNALRPLMTAARWCWWHVVMMMHRARYGSLLVNSDHGRASREAQLLCVCTIYVYIYILLV